MATWKVRTSEIEIPTIPPYVAELVDYTIARNTVPYDIMRHFYVHDDLKIASCVNIDLPVETLNKIGEYFKVACRRYDFEKACILKRYKVTEQLYYLEFPKMDAVILQGKISADEKKQADATYITDIGDVRLNGFRALGHKFTKDEICAIDPRYFAFAVKAD